MLCQEALEDRLLRLFGGQAEGLQLQQLVAGDLADGGLVDQLGVGTVGGDGRDGLDAGVAHDDAVALNVAEALGVGLALHPAGFEELKVRFSGDEITPERKLLVNAISYREESATAVIKKVHKPGKVKADPIHGLFEATIEGKKAVVEYEQDSELRDYEQIPLLEEGGIEAFIQREVWPYAADAWVDEAATKIGYEVSFNRYFYKPQPLRSLEEIRKDIVALEKETEGLLQEIIS